MAMGMGMQLPGWRAEKLPGKHARVKPEVQIANFGHEIARGRAAQVTPPSPLPAPPISHTLTPHAPHSVAALATGVAAIEGRIETCSG